MSDRLSRPERRILQRQDEQFLDRPLILSGDPRSMAAHIRQVVKLLKSPTETSPCSAATLHLATLYDRTVPASAAPLLACKRGCYHCCTQMVTVMAPEAFLVAATIRRRTKTVAAVFEADTKTRALSLDERLKAHVRCPLLDDTVCSVYAARPLGCHAFISTSLAACLGAFERDEVPNIPMPGDYVSIVHACRMVLVAAMRLAGLRDATFELNAALAVILADENAEVRWLKGEDIFASLEAGPPPPSGIDQSVREMMAFVAPTL